MREKEVFYVEIPNPVDCRRSVLEASRDLLRGLQKYEDLKKIRFQKLREMSVLKNIIKEINTLLNQARNSLPSVTVRIPEPAKQKEAKKAQRPKKKAIEEEEAKKPREVAELEKQLKDIEGKLTGLG